MNPLLVASDLGRRAPADHLELPDRRLREEEDPFVAAPLVPLERVVEVGAVEGHVRVDGSLACDDEAVAVRFLDDGRVSCANSVKSRPRIGRSDTARTPTVLLVAVSSLSSSGAPPLTVTVSATFAILSERS